MDLFLEFKEKAKLYLRERGRPGKDGKSAYEIWLEQGNEGTEEDFLESLKGDDYILTEADKEDIADMAAEKVQKPDIPEGMASEDWVNENFQPKGEYVTDEELEERLKDVSPEGYATEEWTNENFQPKGDYLKEIPAEYVTDTELAAKGYQTAQQVENYAQPKGDYAKNKDVFDYTKNPLFTNIFDTVGIEYGKILNADGTVSDTTASLAVTDYIPVKSGDVLNTEDFPISAAGSEKIVIYDASFNKLQSVTALSFETATYYVTVTKAEGTDDYNVITINKPSTVAYLKICTNSTVIGKKPVLTINEPIEYEMGYGSKLNENIKVEFSQILNSPQKNCWSILPNEHINIAYSQVNANGKAVKPINTLEHFIYVSENYGYNTLKCDVRPTSDGELVLCHDAGFTFDSNGYITTYDSANSTVIRNVTAETVLGYSFKTGEHPCLIGDYLKVCRKYGKVAFITIRNEYMDVVIPKLIEELKKHNMTYATIINCMTYDSLVTWRTLDSEIMINYTLSYGANIDSTAIDKAVALGYCSLCGFGLSSSSTTPTTTCDFEYARENGIRLLQAIAYKDGTAEDCYALGYDGCQIGYAWKPIETNADTYSKAEIDAIMGSYIDDVYSLLGG